MALVDRPAHRRPAVHADVDALERGDRHQQPEARSAAATSDPSTDEREVPPVLAGARDVEAQRVVARGHDRPTDLALEAVAVVGRDQLAGVVDVQRVPAALVAVSDEDAGVARRRWSRPR